MQEVITDKQLEFITWLTTELIERCQTIEEVKEVNRKIRKKVSKEFKAREKEEE